MTTFYPPKFNEKQFNCPYCNVYARQSWDEVLYRQSGTFTILQDIRLCTCSHCRNKSFWYDEKLMVPDVSTAPIAHIDMPESIKLDYNEAASILSKSPRGTAALLRLCLQKLMRELGEPGKDINQDIGSLVKKGLPSQVQQALDIVRVVGNESVHPGTLDLSDDFETANQLFHLINFIIEDRIARPKAIQSLFDKLPEGKRKGIENRDKIKIETP